MANAGVEKYKKDFAWAQNELYNYAKSINLPLEKRKDNKKEYIKLFNITILKIYYSKNTVKYRLFGFIPFIVKIRV